MRKFLLVLLMILALTLVGCENQETVVENNSGNQVLNQEISGENKIEEKNEVTSNQNLEVLKKTTWQIRHLEDAQGMQVELNIHYGSAILQYGYGSLEFYDDGTFVENRPGVSDGPKNGTYSLNGNDLILTYDNEYERKGTIQIYDNVKQLILKDDEYTYYFNDVDFKFSEEEIIEELDKDECLYVTEVINNMDDTYTLKGIIYTLYTLTEAELNAIVDKGVMVLNGETYEVDKVADDDDSWMWGPTPEYGLYYYWEDERRLLYTIGKENDEYLITLQADYHGVWKETGIHKEITVNKDVACEEGYTGEITTVEEAFSNYQKLEPIGDFGVKFEFENGECKKIMLPHNY